MKAFKKGQKVTRIVNWDCKGTFVYRQATVHSCGKVQMVLTDALTGEEMGRHFRPDGTDGTYQEMTDSEAEARCLELAADYLATQAARLERFANETQHGQAYCQAMRDKLNDLHEARAVEYNAALDAIRNCA